MSPGEERGPRGQTPSSVLLMWWVLAGIGGVIIAYVALGLVLGERVERRPARAPREPVTLKQAADRGIVPCAHEALRKAAQRDSRFPAPIGFGPRSARLYRPVDLVGWHQGRPGSPTRLRPRRSTVDHRLATAQRHRGEDERARRQNRLLVVDAGR